MKQTTASVLFLALLVPLAPADRALAQAAAKLAAQGKALLTKQCSKCHQVEAAGASPLAAAPPFHEVMRRYSPEDLEEALAEGLSSGHEEMPEFVFEPEEVEQILTYLGTLRRRR